MLSPLDLCQYHLVVSPPTARLYTTVTRWFAEAGALPQRLSMCNSLSVTMLTILQGAAIGIVPVRVMQDDLERGRAKLIPVMPEVPSHRVSLCYQSSEFGPGLKVLADLTREPIAEYRLFT